ncbi:hypothetical protein UPYG_G00327070 [Umbra pygmaea]|uniref:Collagen alpha-1(XXI) chain n=1 Tax=Umbra pygmaea TaxID=75934 RepID=A0ABD0W344_UMBPY
MACKPRSIHCVLQCLCFMLLHLSCTGQDEDMRFSCKTVASDLVFILDGSWSVSDVNFEIVKRWLVNITKSFNIGQKFTQVGVVQYSDNPIINIPLGEYLNSQKLIEAMENIEYMGGNTRTGAAIQFATDRLFKLSERNSRGIARIAVVVTDGKSQDEVKAAAEEARGRGIILFAIGVGLETEEAELRAIGNKPSSTYVFYVDDYKAISKMRDTIRQKICEESVCPNSITDYHGDVKGFDILKYLNLSKKVKKTQGSLFGTKAFQVTSRVDLSESTKNLFPDGLPPSYVFVSTLRYKGSLLREQWDLWRIQTKDGKLQMAVTLNGLQRNVMFTTTSLAPSGTQTVVFQKQPAKVLFDEGWHQLRLLVTEHNANLYVDDQYIESQPLDPPDGIFLNGKTQIGKYVRKETTVPFEIMKLKIYCDPEQNNREMACEIPGVCYNVPGDIDVDPTPEPCSCPAGPPGPPGVTGETGAVGKPGPTGTAGKPGIPGNRGIPGLQGPPGAEGRRGVDGNKGEQGRPGDSGERGFPGLPGLPGKAGEKGSIGLQGQPGIPGKDGKVGEKGEGGLPGPAGYPGAPGLPGRDGTNGLPGEIGQKGEVGSPGIPGLDGREGHPGMPGVPGNVGQTGTKGEAGLPGHKGEKGSPGTSGDNGLPGEHGLTGQPGTKGSKGERGLAGQPGFPGLEGKSGESGTAGQPGHPGMPGLAGLKGQRGELGERGPEGLKGEKGDKGIPGSHVRTFLFL